MPSPSRPPSRPLFLPSFRPFIRRLRLHLWILLAVAAWNEAAAAPGPKTRFQGAGIDTAAVRRLYLDGEFEPAIAMLEKRLQSGAEFSHDDSVFAFKHLGVMYAAKYETREKGKLYMHKLLQAEPTARIMDMYASDMIYMIFKNIQDEFEASRRRYVRAEAQLGGGRMDPGSDAGKPKPEATGKGSRRSSSSLIWMGAAAVATAGAVAVYYYSDDEPETRTLVEKHWPD